MIDDIAKSENKTVMFCINTIFLMPLFSGQQSENKGAGCRNDQKRSTHRNHSDPQEESREDGN